MPQSAVKRVRRLNGWQRIGIILSVIWILVGGFWGNSIGIHEGDLEVTWLGICLKIHPDDWAGCHRDFNKDFAEAIQYHWYYAAFLAFAPIPVAWWIVYGLVGLGRWVGRGFRQSYTK
jgi:hypothetical protein